MVYRCHNKLHLYLPLFCSYGATPLPTGTHWFILCICESASFFIIIFTTSLLYFLDSTHTWYCTVFVFPWLVSLSTMPFKSIYVAASGKISFFLKKESLLCSYLVAPLSYKTEIQPNGHSKECHAHSKFERGTRKSKANVFCVIFKTISFRHHKKATHTSCIDAPFENSCSLCAGIHKERLSA